MTAKLFNVAVILLTATYLFFGYLPKGTFYIGIAIVFFMFALIFYIRKPHLFATFFLLCSSVSNLADELFFNPLVLQENELIFALTLPILWLIKCRRNARKVCAK